MIHIPKRLLEQSGIDQFWLKFTLKIDLILLHSASQSREAWEEAFSATAGQQDDSLTDEMTATEWDNLEWEW